MKVSRFRSDQHGFNETSERIDAIGELPVFMRPGWMTATCRGAPWGGVIAEDDSRIHGLMLYRIVEKYGITYLSKPVITPYLGPWVQGLPDGDYARRSRENEIQELLIDGLPEHQIFSSNFRPEDTNWLPFFWKGYSQTTRYSYRVNLDRPREEVLADFTRKRRSEVKKAIKNISVEESTDHELLVKLNNMTFIRQGARSPNPDDEVRKLSAWLAESGNGTVLVGRDTEGVPHSCMLLTWDHLGAYGILQGENPDLRKSGASMAIINHAINMTCERNGKFLDYCGSMVPRLEFVRRSCGGIQSGYPNVYKVPSKLMKIVMQVTGYPFKL